MASDNELTRLAGMACQLQPDWNPRSVRSILAGKHRDRAFGDLAVALAVICSDPETKTPGRLDERGPWWDATRALMTGGAPDIGPGLGNPRCALPGHEHEHRDRCRLCRAERLTETPAARPAPPVPPPADWRATTPTTTDTRENR